MYFVSGGFRAQGRTAVKARELLDDALRLQDAGAFGVVIECVPAPVATAITDALEIPTIGIGAGSGTNGQVLVYHDMLGMQNHPHHQEFVPKFCKQYVNLGHDIVKGLEGFRDEVKKGIFPSDEYSPYKMSKEEEKLFSELLDADAEERKHQLEKTSRRLKSSDEYEALGLYGKS